MISSKIIADSVNTMTEDRLTTFIVTFPRIILAEFNTHRMFSRNSASSRAIPFEKMIKAVKENPFIPIAWQKDHSGMQGTEYITDENELAKIKTSWLDARDYAIKESTFLSERNVTKQLCNRLLENYMYHTVIITSGKEGLENFFDLRCPKYVSNDKKIFYKSKKDWIKANPDTNTENWTKLDWLKINTGQAEIHIMELSELMWDNYNESKPKILYENDWHIPFGDYIDDEKLYELSSYKTNDGIVSSEITDFQNEQNLLKVKIAIARCARVSYTVIGEENKKDNYENDLKLFDRLLDSKHFSPFEHCAKVMNYDEYERFYKGELYVVSKTVNYETDEISYQYQSFEENQGWCLNYKGFIQYRYLIN